MSKINELLAKLNSEQIKPVLDTEGAVLVIAGAGSGKTRVLTSRIAYLILEKGVSPYNVMAITFTNKAAGEMKERLSKIIPEVGVMWVSTIHSMCVRILRKDIERIGYDKNFTIYDETDKDRVLKRVFEDLGYDVDKLFKNAKNLISNAKNNCQTPDEFLKENSHLRFAKEYTEIFRKYDEYLENSNSLDFDDLLCKTYKLFVEHKDVLEYYSNKFQYIHIDEFQDTNKVQFAICRMLSQTHGNIFVVGDDDQSIYGWRGAQVENILCFDEVFRGAKVYKLEQNYRSTKKILELANAIIKYNTGRKQKELWTENDEGVRVETFVGTDENNEASFAALQIKNLMARSSLDYKDFAVFMRINAISRPFEQEFTKYGIPYRIFGGVRFFERKEIKDILAYLKIINNRYDDESFLRSISTPKRGIGDKTLRDLKEFCTANGLSLYQGISQLHASSISPKTQTKLVNYKMLIDSFYSYSNSHSVVQLIDYILETTCFEEQFAENTEENHSRLMNISELKHSAFEFEKDNPNTTLADYLSSVTLSTDVDDINSENAVTIATIHASKGLEYPCVFVTGLDEKIIPSPRCVDDESQLEEERRLMYVAVTRAMKRLYLTRASSRYLYGNREPMMQSRFLKEAKSVLYPNQQESTPVQRTYNSGYSFNNSFVDDREYSSTGGYSSDYARRTLLNGNKPKENKNADFSKYKSGVKVKHTKFGDGVIINVKGSGDNIIVEVAFKGVGIKSLSAKFAPMEIV